MKKLGIYVHIPFCHSKCSYCDFYSLVDSKEDDHAQYVDYVVSEIKRYAKSSINSIVLRAESLLPEKISEKNDETESQISKGYIVDSIFIGGGTPTVISPHFIVKIVETIKQEFTVCDDVEITIESNPKTLTKDRLQAYRESGINRLSMGVQSMSDPMLLSIGRIHTKRDVLDSFQMARESGFKNINVDLIFSLPNQTVEDWENTLAEVFSLNPEHISFYSLQIEEGTPLYEKVKAGDIIPLSDNHDRKMYYLARDMLLQNGYNCYEISNSKKEKFECRHNLKYWSMADYIGIGSGASSFVSGKRFSYQYKFNFSELPYREFNENTISENISEFVFTGLRKTDGISKRDFKSKFNVDFWKAFQDARKNSAWMIEEKYLIECDDRIYLSSKGIDISNRIMAEFV